MIYLITGITGFVGPHLANVLLSEGHEVYGLLRNSNGMETDILDIVDSENFAKIKFMVMKELIKDILLKIIHYYLQIHMEHLKQQLIYIYKKE